MIRPLRAAVLLALAFIANPLAAATLEPDLTTLPSVPQLTLPSPPLERELARAPRKERPFDFAVGVDLPLAARHGAWSSLDGGARAWRVRIASPGAYTLSVHVPAPALPAQASLWVYDPAGRFVHGPYRTQDATPSGLWTPIVPGAQLVIELRAPAGTSADFDFGAVRVYHGYRDWKSADAPAKAGGCNIDVACSEGDPWQDESRSVARLEFGTERRLLCSGQLLNNVRQDRTPFFLTADHCGLGDEEPADSAVFYFNYEAPACGGPSSLNLADTAHGATFLADDVQSDFTLLRITGALPRNVYFAGWNATGAGSASGASIHHPSGDEKKISLFDTAVSQTAVRIGRECPVDSWEVRWSRGTTEQGSSGAGLWNAAHQIIGVLSGGLAACGPTPECPSCGPDQPDYFGRLDRAWTANRGADGQLKAHLDPDGSCVATVPGFDPVDPNPGPVGPTTNNTRCEGQFSECAAGGGGGSPGAILLAALLALALLRRRP